MWKCGNLKLEKSRNAYPGLVKFWKEDELGKRGVSWGL